MTQQLEFKDEYAWALIIVLISAFIASFLSVQAGVWMLLFSVLGWWVWQNPREGLMFLLVTMPVLPMLKVTQTVGTLTLLKDVVIIILFLRTFFVPLLQKKIPYRQNILVLPIFSLIIWVGVNVLRAESLVMGIVRAREVVLYLLLFFAVLYLPRDKRFYRQLIAWAMSSFVVVVTLSVYQWFFAFDSSVLRFDPARSIWIPRVSSVLAHPSVFGEYLIAIATLLLSLMIYFRNIRTRIFTVLGVLITTFLIYFTYSRAVWLGLMVSFGLMAAVFIGVQSLRLKKISISWRQVVLGITICIVLGGALLRFTSVGIFLRSAIDPTYGSNEERIEFMARLVSSMNNIDALFGKGLGNVVTQNFREVNVSTYDIATGASRTVQLAKNSTLVDNQYLKTFVELGLVGILIYFWVYWRILKYAVLNVWRGKSKRQSIVGLWGIGFLAAFVLQALFIDIWDIFPTNLLFWLVAGFVSRESVS